jgi:hypothetical protein
MYTVNPRFIQLLTGKNSSDKGDKLSITMLPSKEGRRFAKMKDFPPVENNEYFLTCTE